MSGGWWSRGGGGGLDLLPKWHRKYLPSATWPSRRILSILPSPFFLPSLLRSAERQPEPPRSARQAAKSRDRKKSFPSRCQRSRKFNCLERLGFAFLKPLRAPRGRRARHRCEGKKIESCQMIFVLSNDLGGKGTLRTLASGLYRRP